MKILLLLLICLGSANASDLSSIALSNVPNTKGKCLRSVRIAVQKYRGKPLVGETLSAKDFSGPLVEKYGAVRLPITDPAKAPLNAIIIYAGSKRSRHGHIEIKTMKGFVSDHLAKTFYRGSKVKGIYVL